MPLFARLLRIIEILCWAAGAALVVFFVGKLGVGEARRVSDVASFKIVYPDEAPDQSLWSESRIRAYDASRSKVAARVVAVLSIPDIGLEVPVYQNADDLELDRGVGLIEGTAALEDGGNTGIAGHRDGYFRVLKDVKIGHRILLRTVNEMRCYNVSQTLIVDPDNVEVLAPAKENIITLVTCYPFYYIGPAPRRFIVRAQIEKNLS